MNERFWHNKRVLVTGHEGFLGSNLVRALITLKCKVTGIDKVSNRGLSVLNGIRGGFSGIKLNLSDLPGVRRAVARCRPQIIFHLAAEAIVGRAKKDPLNVFKSNVQGTWNLLESCRGNRNIAAVLVASSDKAYGTALNLPYHEDTPLKGRQTYDASKSCEDIIAQSYFYSYGVPACVVRCGNIYGPGDFNFSRLIPDAIRSALKNRQFVIRSDGTYTRDYVYVDDVISAYLMIAEKMRSDNLYGEPFNVSDEKPQSVKGVLKAIEKVLAERTKKPLIKNRAHDEIRDQYLSSKKIRKMIGWKAEHSFEEGLKKTIEWYKEVL